MQLHPDVEPTTAELDDVRAFEATITFEETSRHARCRLCGQPAVFLVPDGLVCDEHAWQAAARIDWAEADPWVPISISNGRSLE